MRAFGCLFLKFTLLGFLSDLMVPLMMYSLKFIIEYLQKDSPDITEGIVLLLIFTFLSFMWNFLRHVFLFYAY